MSGPLKLKYHQATFDMLGREPILSEQAIAEIEKWERRTKRKLPGAIKEWYSLQFAQELVTFSHEFRELRSCSVILKDIEEQDRKPDKARMVAFAYEVDAALCVRLDGPANPPVLSRWDDSEEVAKGRLFSSVQRLFSEVLFQWLWSHSGGADPCLSGYGGELEASEVPFGPGELDFILERFTLGLREFHEIVECPNPFRPEEMMRMWVRSESGKKLVLKPGATATGDRRYDYYFYAPGVRLLVQIRGDEPVRTEQIAMIQISADSSKRLEEVACQFWEFSSFARECRAESKEGNNLLRKLRRRFGSG